MNNKVRLIKNQFQISNKLAIMDGDTQDTVARNAALIEMIGGKGLFAWL